MHSIESLMGMIMTGAAEGITHDREGRRQLPERHYSRRDHKDEDPPPLRYCLQYVIGPDGRIEEVE